MPEIFFSYRGLDVFHVYYRDNSQQELHYWYAIYPENDPANKKQAFEFDIRDFQVETEENIMKLIAHKEVLRQVIDNKVLPGKDWLEEHKWKFRLGRSKKK